MTISEKLKDRYAAEIMLWKLFYGLHAEDETLEESIFDDVAMGFFLALGIRSEVLTDEGPLADAKELARMYGG